MESAGGQCLPCEVDIREEAQVKAAVDKAVERFGGIDVLVNNASAISITGTLDTTMKKYVEYLEQTNWQMEIHMVWSILRGSSYIQS